MAALQVIKGPRSLHARTRARARSAACQRHAWLTAIHHSHTLPAHRPASPIARLAQAELASRGAELQRTQALVAAEVHARQQVTDLEPGRAHT